MPVYSTKWKEKEKKNGLAKKRKEKKGVVVSNNALVRRTRPNAQSNISNWITRCLPTERNLTSSSRPPQRKSHSNFLK